MNIVDTHTHLFVEEFDADRDATVARAIAAGVTRMCLPCITEASLEGIMAMCNRYPRVCFPTIGLHPTDVSEDYLLHLQRLKKHLSDGHKFVAIGEVGLDLYWDTTYEKQQKEALEIQMGWAKEHSLPLIIHSRNAFAPLYDIMDAHRSYAHSGIFHCFSGDKDEAAALLSFDGFMLGIGGTLTYKKSTLPKVLGEVVPLERVVVETDSPYLAPVPHRGRRNESAYVVKVVEMLAGIYGTTPEEVARITTENAERVMPGIK